MIKIKQLKKANLVGKSVPTNQDGHAGRYIEHLLESSGYSINRGHGCDIKRANLEVKSRDLDATSPQTVATMTRQDIINTDYYSSVVCEKIQQQLRVKTRDGVIVESKIYDFSDPYIQNLIAESYESARASMLLGNVNPYVAGGDYGYFEQTGKSESYSFRMSQSMMDRLESMSSTASTFNSLFEVQK